MLAAAPVLFAGRPTFSAYMVLTDSAVHMVGADYLIHHGQQYAHLDLFNSYGLDLSRYFGAGYPTGADALLGGSAGLLGVPIDLGLPALQRAGRWRSRPARPG